MKIYSVFDSKFNKYGKVLEQDFSSLLTELKKTAMPESGVSYTPSVKEMEDLPIKDYIENYCFGGMLIQIGCCNGQTNCLNALEYHKGNEINLADVDIILLLGDARDIVNGKYETDKVQAFCLPTGVAVEIYSTTLHYAPCGKNNAPYRTVIILPKGTNYAKPSGVEYSMLWGSNKWLLAHKDSPEAQKGAHVGLIGNKIVLE